MPNNSSSADSSFSQDRNPDPAAQAQAALLLLESLIHSLLDKGVLSKDEVAEAFRSAIEVKQESAEIRKEDRAILEGSIALLDAMSGSVSAHSGQYDSNPGQ